MRNCVTRQPRRSRLDAPYRSLYTYTTYNMSPNTNTNTPTRGGHYAPVLHPGSVQDLIFSQNQKQITEPKVTHSFLFRREFTAAASESSCHPTSVFFSCAVLRFAWSCRGRVLSGCRDPRHNESRSVHEHAVSAARPQHDCSFCGIVKAVMCQLL